MRSVNHRYSDITIKLPDYLRFLEGELRSVIAVGVNRGKVECSLNIKTSKSSDQAIVVNDRALSSLLAATRQIESQMSSPSSFSALEVLAFPGIRLESNEANGLPTQIVIDLVRSTLSELMAVRVREGTQLRKILEDRCDKIQGLVMQAKKRMPEVLSLLRSRLRQRVVEAVAEPDLDRLEQELVLLAQKLDIAEELDRLDAHIIEALRTLGQSEPVGRRLDFLMQELNREANTLGSKSADREMTQISIELKVLIEQMREQIQNIE